MYVPRGALPPSGKRLVVTPRASVARWTRKSSEPSGRAIVTVSGQGIARFFNRASDLDGIPLARGLTSEPAGSRGATR